jgi:SNF2 family DNA or RNA helicase
MSEDSFQSRFNPTLKIERRDPVTGKTTFFLDERTGRHAELQARLRANFMTRHLKRDVMPQLQMPIYDIIQVDETSAVKQALAAESLLDIDPENLQGADASILGHVAAVRKQMGLALAPQAAEYIEMLLDGGEEKLVVFGWHLEVLDILQKALHRYGVLRIDGSTSTAQRQKNVDEFQTDSKKRVILGNIQSMGTGVDGLQKVSNHALIVEPSWTPGENIQAFDRLDRGGQTRVVQGDIFVAPNSFSERVLASALRKLQTTNKSLDKTL